MDFLGSIAPGILHRIESGYYDAAPPGAPPGPAPSLAAAVRRASPRALVAEIKPSSPKEGHLRDVRDPTALARSLVSSGACGLSVLTQPDYFHGSLEHLLAASEAGAPVLMKDIVLHESQIEAGRRFGASCVLLIQRAFDRGLTGPTLEEAIRHAQHFRLEVLLEVASEDEYERALDTEADLLGVNNRDLETLATDLSKTERILSGTSPDRPVLALSGVETAADVARMVAAGTDGVLVGSSVMRAPDPAAKVRELVSR
ncbi:MAG: indole-3-glycerol-phosphate synthase [Methanobacteriota archaeon]